MLKLSVLICFIALQLEGLDGSHGTESNTNTINRENEPFGTDIKDTNQFDTKIYRTQLNNARQDRVQSHERPRILPKMGHDDHDPFTSDNNFNDESMSDDHTRADKLTYNNDNNAASAQTGKISTGGSTDNDEKKSDPTSDSDIAVQALSPSECIFVKK